MTDLSPTIIARSDQLNADDLIGGPRTITITRVTADPSSAEQPVTVHYEGENGRPFKPCKSMRRVMVAVWGAQGDAMVGQSMTLYRDASVQFGGLAVGGIRISHMTGIDQDKQLALMVTRGRKAPYRVKPLKAPAPAPRGEADDGASVTRDKMKRGIETAPSLPVLADRWEMIVADLHLIPDPMRNEVEAAHKARKAALTGADPAMQAPQGADVEARYG